MNKNIHKTIFLIILLFSIIITNNVYSQNTGAIQGKVIDAENGEGMRRATIMLVGTNKGTYSDVRGEYKLADIEPGIYTLRISFVGYETQEITQLLIEEGQTISLNITLNYESKMKDEIVVEARRAFDNEAGILAQRKGAAQVSDGLSMEQISKLPDSDAGQSLKRVSGVTLVNNKHIFVRGVSERYSNTTLNGAALTSTEPDKKAFSFDMFPAEFLQNVNIAKSFTPDLPGNFAGGLVQLNTVDFPESRTFKVSLSSNINTNVSMKDNEFVKSTRSSTDWLARDNGMRKLSSIVPKDRLEFNDLQNRARNPFDTTGARTDYEAVSRSFSSDLYKRENVTIGPIDNKGISMSYTDVYSINKNDFGIIANFNYSNSNSINNLQRNAYLATFDTLYYSNGKVSETNYSLGGLLNLAYKLGPNHIFHIKNVFNRSADDQILMLDGMDIGYQYFDYKTYSYQFVQKQMYSGQMGGEHSLSFLNSLIDWRVGYSYSDRDEPDFRRFMFRRSVFDLEFDPNTPYTLAIANGNWQGDGTTVGRFYSYLEDKANTGAFNIEIPIMKGKLKTGFLYENRARDFNARSFTVIDVSNSGLDMEIDEMLSEYESPEKIFAEENFKYDGGFLIGEDSKLSDSYDANENLYAGYLMFDIPFALFNQNFRIITGLRYEDNVQKLNSFDVNNEKVNLNQHTKDWLPSFNLIYSVTNSANLRLSASKTLSRPGLREIAPFTFFDYLTLANVRGNTNLKRALIKNYDLRYEWFPNPGEVVSVSFFYKNFENAIEETIYLYQSELGRTFTNALGEAYNYGIELEYRQNLGVLTSLLDNFMFNVNLALIKTELSVSQGAGEEIVEDKRPMWGQSPYTINLGLFYTYPKWGTSFNIAYNRFGERIIQVAQQGIFVTESGDPHVYEMPRNVVDLSISQPFGNFDVKVSVRDILNEKLVWKQDNRLMASNLTGTNISLSFGYRVW